jgi:xylan 1,4-beta-xylosidase
MKLKILLSFTVVYLAASSAEGNRVLATGMKPFVELGFMPKDLASGTGTIFKWQASIRSPKDYGKWDALITALVRHWTDRYGAAEVKTWRFEVWNEPNLDMFWQPNGKSLHDAYFELYEHTAKAVTSVNRDYVVGGPSGAGPAANASYPYRMPEK